MTIPLFSAVCGEASAVYTIKKSRFIASVKHIEADTEAAAYVSQLRRQYWDARHHCYAYQLGPDGRLQKSSDDGEPAGTAGRPILEVLKKAGITNTIIVVTRYFGGIKLGASGLLRAYSHTAALGLEAASLADYVPFAIIETQFAYSFVSLMERTAPDWQITLRDRQFADTVSFTLQIPQDAAEAWKTHWTNATNGTALLTDQGTEILPVIRPKQKADS